MANFYASYPINGGGVPTYANLAAFPSAVSAGNGALAIALDTNILYESNGAAWLVLANPAYSSAITALTGDVTATGPGSVPATVAKIQGTTVSGTTGTVNVVFSNSPTLVSPALGTPLSGVLTNATGLPLTSGVTGTLPLGNGGTGQTSATAAFNALNPMTTTGDIIYEASANTAARRAIGSSGNVLTVSAGLPVWAAPATSGTVTSVDVSGGSTGLTTSGGPITSSGTITIAGTLAVASGGTNSTTALNNNRFIISTGGKIVEQSAVTGNRAIATDINGLPVASSTTDTELGYVTGVTSAIQTQLNAKAIGPGTSVDSEVALFNGTGGELLKRATGTGVAHVTSGVLSASNVILTSEVTGVLPVANGGTNSSSALNNNRIITSSGGSIVEASAITASRALASNASGIPVASATTDTELGYVSGVTSAIQTQLNAKVAGPGTSVDSEIMLFSGTGGQTAKRATGTGVVHSTSGVYSVSNVVLTSEVTGTLPIANGGTGQTSASTAFNALSPLTTKGDIVAYSTTNARLAVGTDGQILSSDSTQTTGLKWITSSGASTATPTVTGVVTSYFPLIQSAVKTVSSANYTILDTDGYATVLVTTGASQRTITLPAVANNTGRTLTIKKVDSGVGTVLISPNGGTIDGGSSNILTAQYSFVTITGDGTNWYVLDTSDTISSEVLAASPGSNLTTGTAADITSVLLTPGEWMVYGFAASGRSSAGVRTVSQFIGWIDTTSATLPDAAYTIELDALNFSGSVDTIGYTVPTRSFTVTASATTTAYLSIRLGFGVTNSNRYGTIYARRFR